MVQGACLLKRGADIFPIYYRNYLTLCKLCYAFEEKIIFFYHHNFMKKGHSKLSKNKPENIP